MDSHLTKLKEEMLNAKKEYDEFMAENPRLSKDRYEKVIELQESLRIAHERFFSEYLKTRL